MSGAALRVEGIGKAYGTVRVLSDVSLDVPRGACAAVLGPSGCGKSTLLRIVAGLVAADSGRVEIGGRVTDDPVQRVPPESRKVGFVFQDLALWPHMDIAGNLAFVLAARGVKGDEARRRSELAFEAVGLPWTLRDRRPGALSGGERQRAAIARVLVQEPDVVLLDEPLTNLDRELRGQILDMLRSLRRERGLSMLLVTHDRDEAFALADEVVVLRGGRVAQRGSPHAIYASPASRYVATLVGTASCLPVERRGDQLVTALGTWPADGAPSGPLVAVVRPEDLRFGDASPIRARCVDAFYRGDHWLHTVEVEGAGTRVLVRADRPARAGETVALEARRPAFATDDGEGGS